MENATLPPAILTFFTNPSATMSLWRSGSLTTRSASSTAASTTWLMLLILLLHLMFGKIADIRQCVPSREKDLPHQKRPHADNGHDKWDGEQPAAERQSCQEQVGDHDRDEE